MKYTWDGWVSAQAFMLWRDLWCYCLYVAVSPLLGYSQKSCIFFCWIALALFVQPEFTGRVFLTFNIIWRIARSLPVSERNLWPSAKNFFWDLSELWPQNFSVFTQYGQLQSKRFLIAPANWKDFPLSLYWLFISVEIMSLSFPLFHKFILLLLLSSLSVYSICNVKHFKIQDYEILLCFKWCCRMS